jgi:hypothetical protein
MELTDPKAYKFHLDMMYANRLVIWTVTASPSDFRGYFIARPSVIGNGRGPEIFEGYLKSPTIEGLRAKLGRLPGGLTRLERMIADDPVIVEVWL